MVLPLNRLLCLENNELIIGYEMKMMTKKILVGMLCLSCFVRANAQYDIVADLGEYIEAKNYGGKIELRRFLRQEMNYPEKPLVNKVKGVVELSFVVDGESGETSQLAIKKAVSPELDAEAIRLFKLLLFVPAYYQGDRITTRNSLKFKFSPRAYKRYSRKRGYDHIDFSLMNDSSTTIYQNNQVKIKPKIIFDDMLANISSFLQNNLRYPESSFRLGITGVVKLYFIVEPTGRITNIRILKDVGGGGNSEAIRLLKLLKWEPGRDHNGEKVRVTNQFQINFNLSNESDVDYLPKNY